MPLTSGTPSGPTIKSSTTFCAPWGEGEDGLEGDDPHLGLVHLGDLDRRELRLRAAEAVPHDRDLLVGRVPLDEASVLERLTRGHFKRRL